MPIEVSLIVSDAPPLTLASAQRLDYLLYPELPVIIPDAVYYEATRQIDKLGTQEIIDWHRTHNSAVRIEPAQVFNNEIERLARQGAWKEI